MKLDISDDERSAYESSRALALDENGDEVLAGLARQESEFLVGHRRMFKLRLLGISIRPRREAWLKAKDLESRHMVARSQNWL